MADKDYNIIKPVESLYNIAGLTPVKHRQQRKRRQNPQTESKDKPEEEPDGSTEQQNSDIEITTDADDEHSIDYRA
jgi:hypothetical protein